MPHPYQPYQRHPRVRVGRLGLIMCLVLSLIFPPTLFAPPVVWAAFLEAPAQQIPGTAATHYGLAVGDVDGNGTPDIVAAVGGQSRLLLNDGRGHLTEATATHLPALALTALAPILCDVEGDGAPDLLLANAAGRNRLLLNDGQGHFRDDTTSRLPDQHAVSMQMACGDVDGDGDLDLVVANRGSQSWLWLNNGQGVFTDASATHLPRTSDPSYAVRLADVDGNGTLDAVVVNAHRPNRLWRNNGLGSFTDITATHLPGIAGDSQDGTLADVDGDGDLDLLVAAGRDGLRLWRNDGRGVFTEVTATHLPTLRAYGIKVATGDIDGDGAPDIVLATAGQPQLLRNDGTGRFQNVTAALLPSDTRRSFGLAVWDADGDLDQDIVLATPNGPLRLWLNDTAVPRLQVAALPAVPEVGKPVTVRVDAFDEEGLAAATLTLTDPSGTAQEVDLRADLADRHATHTFIPTQVGAYTARVTVTDLSGHMTIHHVTFTVNAPDTTAPQVAVTVAGAMPILVGQPVLLRVTATDDRGVARTTLTINAVPVPLTSDGTATYTPVAPGSYTVIAQATDAAGQSGTGSASFVVEADTSAPVVRVAVTPAVVDLTRPVVITVSATDNVAVTARTLRVTGPAIPHGLDLTLDAAGRATYTPFQPGTYTLTATARDPAGQTGMGTVTFIAQGVVDTTPPTVQLIGVPATVGVGRPVTLTVSATDNVGVTIKTLLIEDTPQPLDAAGRATYIPQVPGTYTVVAWAQDAAGNQGQARATFQALDAAQDTEPPVVALHTPVADATVTAPTEVYGMVTDTTLVRWALEASPRGEGRWTTVATGTSAVGEGVLGTFDPTLLVNDLYELRLSAEDAAGRTAATAIVVRVAGQMKIGHLSFTLEDLALPLAGLPIAIHRTYDSRDVSPGDFGAGWRLDIQTTRLRTGRPLGTDWSQAPTGVTFPRSYCLDLDPARSVTVTLPDGRQEVFDLVPTTPPGSRHSDFGELPEHCQWVAPVEFATAVYQARSGTSSTLEALADNELWVVGDLLLSLDTLDVYAPTRFRLTTPEGLVLELDQRRGVEKLTDSNGNTLTFGPDGIRHSAGTRVAFSRDGQGRITRLTDPMGHTITYAYDPQGDLVAVTDQEGHTTRYTYDPTHKLVAIEDPRGVTVARTLYDEAGRVVAHLDAAGHRIEYTHDIRGQQEVVRDRLGHVTVYTYDERGNVLSETDPLGHTTTSTYDAHGNLLTQTDPLGHTTTWTYDSRGNALTETNPLGHTTTSTYNSRRQLLSRTDPLGHTTTYTYDPSGNLVTQTDALGQTTTYTHSPTHGLLLTMTDPLGYTTRLEHNTAGHLSRQTDPLGHVTTATYDTNGNGLTETATRTTASGVETVTTTYAYDRRNRLVHTTFPDGSTTQVVYNPDGTQRATIDQLGRQTKYDYDAGGRLVRTTYPDGTSEGLTYNAEGHQLTSTDRAGRLTTFRSDSLGRVIETTTPDGATSTTDYDALGRVLRVIDPLGHATQFAYDAGGRRTHRTDPLGQVTAFTYDSGHYLRAITHPHGYTTHYEYNAHHQRTRVLYPDGTSEATAYDAGGRMRSKTDQAGLTTHFAYDALDRLTSVTDTMGQTTRYAYDEAGRLLSQTDANGHTTTFAYDTMGHRIRRTLPLGMTETYAYDVAGNRTNRTDFQGHTTTYAYDTLNRLLRITPDPRLGELPVEFTYTATGQRATMVDASGTTTYAYDERDRLRSKATPHGTLTYTYDAAGNLRTLRSSNVQGASVDYTYDALNRLSTVKDNRLSPGTTTYHYDPVSTLVGYTYPNGVHTRHTYDPLQRLTSLTIGAPTPLASYTYTLGPAGHRLTATELSGRTAYYTYDALYRLTRETIAGTSQPALNGVLEYTYDLVGNRLTGRSTLADVASSTSTYDANDRSLSESYDANGNIIAAQGLTYTYDFAHRLSQTDTGVTIVYDGDGHRVAQTLGAVTTQYLVDDNNPTGYAQVVEELVKGTAQRVYTYGLQRISQYQASGTSFYGYDGHGSVRLLTDASGALSDTYDYDAFGTFLHATGSTPNVYFFAGEAYDATLDLYYNRARYLDVRTGRFWGIDRYEGSLADPQSLHKYLYVYADPVNRRDPSGLVSLTETQITSAIRDTLRKVASIEKIFRSADKISTVLDVLSTIKDLAQLVSGSPESSTIFNLAIGIESGVRRNDQSPGLIELPLELFTSVFNNAPRIARANLKNPSKTAKLVRAFHAPDASIVLELPGFAGKKMPVPAARVNVAGKPLRLGSRGLGALLGLSFAGGGSGSEGVQLFHVDPVTSKKSGHAGAGARTGGDIDAWFDDIAPHIRLNYQVPQQ